MDKDPVFGSESVDISKEAEALAAAVRAASDIPAYPASNWSIVRIYLRTMRLIGVRCEQAEAQAREEMKARLAELESKSAVQTKPAAQSTAQSTVPTPAPVPTPVEEEEEATVKVTDDDRNGRNGTTNGASAAEAEAAAAAGFSLE
eukprot:560885-Prorocentrum_minimum.AAC.1